MGAEESARAVEFGNDMPAIVDEVVARGGVGGLLPGPQTVGSIACGEGGAERRGAVFGVPGKRRIDARPVIQGRVALPVVRRARGELAIKVEGQRHRAQCRQVIGRIGGMREADLWKLYRAVGFPSYRKLDIFPTKILCDQYPFITIN